jgi:hypothetical protein
MSAPQIALVVAGFLLLLTGIGIIIFREGGLLPPRGGRQANIGKRGISLKTNSTGLILVAIGAVLLMVAGGVHIFSK